jgi:hypothetical protein
VTIFARSSSPLLAIRTAPARKSLLALAATAILSAALLVLAAPAGAVVSGNFGVQRRTPLSGAALLAGGPLDYHKGPVLHSSDVYVVYWDPIGNYRGDWERLIDGFFRNVGEASGTLGDVFALDTQYADSHGHAANQLTFRGSYKDEDPYPTSAEGGNCTEPGFYVCLTDRQIQAELHHVITSVDPPLPGATGTPIYYILTPPGVTVCTGSGTPSTCSDSTKLKEEVEKIEKKEVAHPAETGLCGYHSAIGIAGASPIPYVVQPWIAGDAGASIESYNPLSTSGVTPDVLACQDNVSLQEPNQLSGLNPFGNYAEGLADVIINDLSIEQRNVAVNPFLTGWYQSSTSAEQGDVSQFNFGPPPTSPPVPNKETHAASLSNEQINGVSYYLMWAFDSADLTAGKGFSAWAGVSLEPYFTAPNPVNAGDIVGFNATESDITLDARPAGLEADEPYLAPVYAWNFGDGTTVSGTNDANVFHSYQYGGNYTATLTVTDSGANTNSTTRTINVVGPGRPSPASSSGQTTTTATASVPPAPPAPSPAPVPSPVATAAIVSHTLGSVMRSGLLVRYSVNEQVAGHFEVLLDRALARRLGIGGAPAVGLPAGSSPKLVIAKAILVTTTGGHSTVKILLSKRTASRLARLRKVSLTLRLIVRNAASHSPATTTVLAAVTLTH